MNSINQKKDARNDYKEAYKAPGVFMIKNLATEEVFIKGIVDVKSAINRYKFELTIGCNFHKKLQASWNDYGADNFEFSILEEIKKQDKPFFNYEKALEDCEKKWQEKYCEVTSNEQ